jgi:hypothetical protein
MDIAASRLEVARALAVLEANTRRLIETLAHEPAEAVLAEWSPASFIRRVCEAYGSVNYGMEDEVGSSVVCLGVVGVNAATLHRARAVNASKVALKAVCAPLQRVRTRVPVKGEAGGTRAMPVIRVILRHLQRSDLNLLAAYRRIPILEVLPSSVVYTRARTRAVYRKSVEEVFDLLSNMDGPAAIGDRERLASLHGKVKYLALAREHYENMRANVVYSRLDRRGRGRIQVAAELPLMYPLGRRASAPEVHFPTTSDATGRQPRRNRRSHLEATPFLRSLPIYRYTAPEVR